MFDIFFLQPLWVSFTPWVAIATNQRDVFRYWWSSSSSRDPRSLCLILRVLVRSWKIQPGINPRHKSRNTLMLPYIEYLKAVRRVLALGQLAAWMRHSWHWLGTRMSGILRGQSDKSKTASTTISTTIGSSWTTSHSILPSRKSPPRLFRGPRTMVSSLRSTGRILIGLTRRKPKKREGIWESARLSTETRRAIGTCVVMNRASFSAIPWWWTTNFTGAWNLALSCFATSHLTHSVLWRTTIRNTASSWVCTNTLILSRRSGTAWRSSWKITRSISPRIILWVSWVMMVERTITSATL